MLNTAAIIILWKYKFYLMSLQCLSVFLKSWYKIQSPYHGLCGPFHLPSLNSHCPCSSSVCANHSRTPVFWGIKSFILKNASNDCFLCVECFHSLGFKLNITFSETALSTSLFKVDLLIFYLQGLFLIFLNLNTNYNFFTYSFVYFLYFFLHQHIHSNLYIR